MDEARRLPVWSTAGAIWRDTPRLILAHPLLWAGCLALYAAVVTADELLVRPLTIGMESGTALELTLSWAALLLQAAMLIPAALATHRTVVLGIIEPPLAVLSQGLRMLRYGIAEALISTLLIVLTGIVLRVFRIGGDDAGEWLLLIQTAVAVAGIALMLFLILRAAACFPAIAVGDGWSEAITGWRAMRRQTPRAAGIALLSPIGFLSLLWIAVAVALPLTARIVAEPAESGAETTLAANTALLALAAYAWVLTMSHIYRALLGGMYQPVQDERR